jgi:2-keto-3-deoxy-6-phosphogluconate aldolase
LRAINPRHNPTQVLPTGGVDVTTAGDFIKAGAAVLGVGAAVVDFKLLDKSGPAPSRRSAASWLTW